MAVVDTPKPARIWPQRSPSLGATASRQTAGVLVGQARTVVKAVPQLVPLRSA